MHASNCSQLQHELDINFLCPTAASVLGLHCHPMRSSAAHPLWIRGAGGGELGTRSLQNDPVRSGAQFVGKARQLFGGDSAGDDAPEQADGNARLDTALAASGGSRRALAAELEAEAPGGPWKRKKKRRDARDGRGDRSEDGQSAKQAQQARLRALLDSGDVPPLAELQVHPLGLCVHACK